jgi:hypothetical protein
MITVDDEVDRQALVLCVALGALARPGWDGFLERLAGELTPAAVGAEAPASRTLFTVFKQQNADRGGHLLLTENHIMRREWFVGHGCPLQHPKYDANGPVFQRSLKCNQCGIDFATMPAAEIAAKLQSIRAARLAAGQL